MFQLIICIYSSIYINPETNDIYQEGDLLKRPVFGKTLQVIQKEPDAIYTGSLVDPFLEDLKTFGSLITKKDLEDYK